MNRIGLIAMKCSTFRQVYEAMTWTFSICECNVESDCISLGYERIAANSLTSNPLLPADESSSILRSKVNDLICYQCFLPLLRYMGMHCRHNKAVIRFTKTRWMNCTVPNERFNQFIVTARISIAHSIPTFIQKWFFRLFQLVSCASAHSSNSSTIPCTFQSYARRMTKMLHEFTHCVLPYSNLFATRILCYERHRFGPDQGLSVECWNERSWMNESHFNSENIVNSPMKWMSRRYYD